MPSIRDPGEDDVALEAVARQRGVVPLDAGLVVVLEAARVQEAHHGLDVVVALLVVPEKLHRDPVHVHGDERRGPHHRDKVAVEPVVAHRVEQRHACWRQHLGHEPSVEEEQESRAGGHQQPDAQRARSCLLAHSFLSRGLHTDGM